MKLIFLQLQHPVHEIFRKDMTIQRQRLNFLIRVPITALPFLLLFYIIFISLNSFDFINYFTALHFSLCPSKQKVVEDPMITVNLL